MSAEVPGDKASDGRGLEQTDAAKPGSWPSSL